MSDEIKHTLEKQLALLSERSMKSESVGRRDCYVDGADDKSCGGSRRQTQSAFKIFGSKEQLS